MYKFLLASEHIPKHTKIIDINSIIEIKNHS
jgi:hypothetical protein